MPIGQVMPWSVHKDPEKRCGFSGWARGIPLYPCSAEPTKLNRKRTFSTSSKNQNTIMNHNCLWSLVVSLRLNASSKQMQSTVEPRLHVHLQSLLACLKIRLIYHWYRVEIVIGTQFIIKINTTIIGFLTLYINLPPGRTQA